MKRLRILYLEDDPLDVELVEATLQRGGVDFAAVHVRTAEQYRNALAQGGYDVILLDYALPGYDGLSALALARRTLPDTPAIMISGTIGEETAIESLHCGATDYVLKQRLSRLVPALKRALRESEELQRRRGAERALRQSEERFRQLAENIREVFWLTDWPTQQIAYASPAYEGVWGRTREALYRNAFEWLDAVVEDDRPRVRHAFEYAAQSGFDQTYRIRRPDGDVRWIHDRGFPVRGPDGAVYRIAGLAEDVTELKRAQAEREQMIAALEAQNAELERFTYTVSHDLRTPLITIKGFLGLLQEDIVRGDQEAVDEDIARMLAASETMERLLSELLQLSRIGRQVNPSQDVPLDPLVREALALVEGRIAERGVEIEIAPDLPCAYGDRDRLLEVFENLLDNAVKYMGDQARPRVEVGGAARDGEIRVYVRDNGIGIDPRYHDKVFGLFEQLDRKSEGTGVGLALVKRIVEVHGGRVWVESKGFGRGAAFWVALPTRDAAAPSEARSADG